MADGTQFDIYEAVILDLESKIASLQSTVDNLRNMRGVASQITSSVTPQARTPQPVDFGHDAFFGMTVGDAAKKYLNSVKKTVSIPLLVDALLAGGLKSASTNMRENVRSILGRHADFVRINGEFGLAEWYPGRGTAKKTRRSHAEGFTDASSQDESSAN